MTLPNGAAGVTPGLYQTSANGAGTQSITDLPNNDEATVKDVYKSTYITGDPTSVWNNPTGPLGLFYSALGAVPGIGLAEAIIGAIVNALVALLGPIPIVGGVIQNLANFLGLTHTTATQANSNSNPAVVSVDGRVSALEAINGGNGGISDNFNRSTLGADWNVITGTATITSSQYVQAGTSHLLACDYTAITLTTDQVYAQASIKKLGVTGSSSVLICANPAFTNYAAVMYEQQVFSTGLHMITGNITTGSTAHMSVPTAGLNDDDVIGVGYNPTTNVFRIYLNNAQVGTDWTDSGSVVSHGAGHREVGFVCDMDDNGFIGAGFNDFAAYDWT